MGASSLALDPELRVWVFLPLTACIVLMKLIQQFAHTMMNSGGTKQNKELPEIREASNVARSQRLRGGHRLIPESSFKMRRDYFVAENTGLFHQEPKSRSMNEAMATDPSMAVDMLKKGAGGMVPQFAMGWVVNFFFSGFVMGKVPFPLSPRFKPMLQRGIDLASLDVSYFTSLSYYILLLFGLRGAFSLVFREGTVDDTMMMRQQMAGGMGQQQPIFDAATAFKQEVQAYKNLEHDWDLDSAEERAVSVLRSALA
mmetsp:Transcript_13286/g.38615  ORF Transcript_13286/g.38615 Transcript_13286/m.38615 type:complete len:256 (-) Transcript_13286:410-1177(-)|eukprot:362563-Chlamydomonas_euryale.AAC.6